jgi:DNA-binding response OmpR family regulator
MLLPNRVQNGPHPDSDHLMSEHLSALVLSPCSTTPAMPHSLFDPFLLIIDDYPPGQRLLCELSRAVGLRTYASSCINTVPYTTLAQPIAGIIIDSDCHGDSWIDFVRMMRSRNDESASVPVFTLNSKTRLAHETAAADIGVTAVLSKPICVSDFFASLDRWVSPRIEAMRLAWQLHHAQQYEQQNLLFG